MKLNDCGCCEQTESPVLGNVNNDPGLSQIDYRIARFGGFKQAMKNALTQKQALDRLTTRDDSDAVVATVDAWSVVLDVLTFYQERIANENYLRTSTEYKSVVEFGKELGYRLAPGTAATTYMAFKMDDSGYGPKSVRVDIGTKVQSQPGQDELPQVFETVEQITAYPGYNQMPVQVLADDRLDNNRSTAYFAGTDFEVKIGDSLLFVSSGTISAPTTDVIAVSQVTAVEKDNTRKVTKLTWNPALPATIVTGASDPGPRVFIMRLKVALFGYNAIDYNALPLQLTIGDKRPDNGVFKAGPFAGLSGSWADAALTGTTIDLESLYPTISIGSWIVLQNSAHIHIFQVDGYKEQLASRYMMAGKVSHLTINGTGITNFSAKDTAVLAQSEPLTLAQTPLLKPLTGSKLTTANKIVRPDKGRKLLIQGKPPRMKLLVGVNLTDKTGATIGAIAPGETVWLQAAPLLQPSGFTRYSILRKDTASGFIDLMPSDISYLPATDEDTVLVSEVVEVSEIQTGAIDNPTDVFITENLTYAYDRPTTKIFGNVALSTHGETKNEVMGSGNAASSFQRFDLRNKPLTYLAAQTETGYESTLQVRVNDVLWHEVPTLYAAGPKDRIYTARQDDTYKTTVGFGDGKSGARTETGTENISAKYRVGSGLAGRVRSGQLNMLLTRPLGITDALNPIAATGGSDPENTVDARTNMPKSVLTLGRIVSVEDFSDHAARYPGVAKAQSALLWNGTHQVVHLTVAGPGGEAMDTTDLAGSIDSIRDTHFPVVIQNSETLTFTATIAVLVREDYLAEKVLPAVQDALTQAFSFDNRLFSEAVTISEILAVVQPVPGVEAANVEILDFTTNLSPIKNDVIRIKAARAINGVLFPAQILLLDPKKLSMKEMVRDL